MMDVITENNESGLAELIGYKYQNGVLYDTYDNRTDIKWNPKLNANLIQWIINTLKESGYSFMCIETNKLSIVKISRKNDELVTTEHTSTLTAKYNALVEFSNLIFNR